MVASKKVAVAGSAIFNEDGIWFDKTSFQSNSIGDVVSYISFRYSMSEDGGEGRQQQEEMTLRRARGPSFLEG